MISVLLTITDSPLEQASGIPLSNIGVATHNMKAGRIVQKGVQSRYTR